MLFTGLVELQVRFKNYSIGVTNNGMDAASL